MLLYKGLQLSGWCKKQNCSAPRATSLHAYKPAPHSSPFARYYKPTFSRDPWIGLNKQQHAQDSKSGKSFQASKPKPYIDWYAEEMLRAVRQQAEYYLSPQNLSTDKLMQQALKKGRGWIPIALICEFPRMADKEADPGMLLRALQGSDVVEISANQKLLRPRGRCEDH